MPGCQLPVGTSESRPTRLRVALTVFEYNNNAALFIQINEVLNMLQRKAHLIFEQGADIKPTMSLTRLGTNTTDCNKEIAQ